MSATVGLADEGIEMEFDGSTSIVVPDVISVLVKVCNNVAVWRTSVLGRSLKLVSESVVRDVVWLTVGWAVPEDTEDESMMSWL